MLTFSSPTAPAPFDINAPIIAPDGTPRETARFPQPDAAIGQYALNVHTYLDALHVSMHDVARGLESALSETVKALGVPPQAYSYATASLMPDPANAGLLPWPGIAPESLRKIARENIAPQLVIRSRVTDVARYSGLSTHIWEPGWQIGLRDASETPTETDRKDIRDAERFVWNCNRESSYQDARQRDAHLLAPFDMFLRAFADDTHTLDAWAIWTDMDRNGRIKAFTNLPAGNVRLAIPGKGYSGDVRYFAALVDETGNPVQPFTRDQLVWTIRNPRTDPATWGYGFSEIEMCILMVQAFQSGIQLNADTFTRNGIPNGMLLLKGDFFNQTQIDALMREWTNMKRGVSKTWGMPVMSIPEKAEVELLPFMDLKGEELRYKDHLNLMGGLYCVVSQFPPHRLGIFASGQHKDNAPLRSEAVESPSADDPGLSPLLSLVANRVNEYLLWPNWPRLKMWFNGANPKQDAREYEARKLARTWRESRADVDLPELTKDVPGKFKEIMELMQFAPEDPAKASIFQTVATKWLEIQAAEDAAEGAPAGAAAGPQVSGKDTNKVGAPFPSKTDPGRALDHGHRAGTRRDGGAEAAHAEATP